MLTYKFSLSSDRKTVSLRAGADTAPVGDTDLGSFVHGGETDANGPDVNHVLFHHVRDALYKRKASDGSSGASYPEGIYNIQEIDIVYHGPVLNHVYLTAADVEVAESATVNAVVKYVLPTDPVTEANANADDLTFVSSDEAKATVDAAGVVTGVAEGEANITATSKISGKSVTLKVTVTAA